MLGTVIPSFIIGVYRSKRRFPLVLIGTLLSIMSLSAHKEFRFILPILPLCFSYAGDALADLQARSQTGKRFGRWFLPSLLLVLSTNFTAIIYFSQWYQRAPVAVMEYISDNIASIGSADFLTPCHSTPFYSHIHRNIPMRILECEPQFKGDVCVGDRSQSQSEVDIALYTIACVLICFLSNSLPIQ
jgi:GPI mannosyltransferase 3